MGSILRDRIAQEGPLTFADFMTTALYHPGLGYYACQPRQIGRAGDFFTSVSVGPLFGQFLAGRFLREWNDRGQPAHWRIIECGAHDGKLAADVLAAIEMAEPRAFAALDYAIPEPLPALQDAQRETLQRFEGRVRFLTHPQELAALPLPGIAYGNELLDALPFHVVEWRHGAWQECRVALAPDGRFFWQTAAITEPGLIGSLLPLGVAFPDGYRTEFRSGYRAFLEPLASALDGGLMLWIDYGFARPEYYHPDRSAGTLRTFSRHRAGEDPLALPGETDITAHVDFTALAEAAIALGGHPMAFQSQGSWLLENARDWLLEQEGTPQSPGLRQFQTLAHPAHLGARFHVIELSWHPAATPSDPAALAHRLFASA